MTAEMAGRSVIVTGAAEGIGLAVARKLHERGAKLTLVDVSPKLEPRTAALDGAVRIVADIADAETADEATARAAEAHGGVQGLANVAGLVVNGTAVTVDMDAYERCMAVNVTATLRLIRAVVPIMVKSRGGSIVNFASVVGLRGRQDGVAYVTAKSAILGLMRSVALDFGRLGVRCNSISAGAVDTPMLRGFEAVNPGAMTALAQNNHMGRIATSDEVAELCSFLLSDRVTYVNGADIAIDGGDLAAFGPARPAAWSPLADAL